MDQPLALQAVKNLVFLGKAFCNSSSKEPASDGEDSGSDEESKLARIIRSPLPWLFSKLSYQLRTAHLKRRNSAATTVSIIKGEFSHSLTLYIGKLVFGTHLNCTMVRRHDLLYGSKRTGQIFGPYPDTNLPLA
jgi:hypothetical protein